MCAACLTRFMCHHEFRQISVCPPFTFLNISLGLAHLWTCLQKFLGCFPYDFDIPIISPYFLLGLDCYCNLCLFFNQFFVKKYSTFIELSYQRGHLASTDYVLHDHGIWATCIPSESTPCSDVLHLLWIGTESPWSLSSTSYISFTPGPSRVIRCRSIVPNMLLGPRWYRFTASTLQVLLIYLIDNRLSYRINKMTGMDGQRKVATISLIQPKKQRGETPRGDCWPVGMRQSMHRRLCWCNTNNILTLVVDICIGAWYHKIHVITCDNT